MLSRHYRDKEYGYGDSVTCHTLERKYAYEGMILEPSRNSTGDNIWYNVEISSDGVSIRTSFYVGFILPRRTVLVEKYNPKMI